MKVIRIEYMQPERVASVELPLSKSVALRAMTLNEVSAILSDRRAEFPALPDAEDVAGMHRAIKTLTSCTEVASRAALRVASRVASRTNAISRCRVNIGEGGAPFRFFTALTASVPGVDLTLTTRRPLIQRPHAILLDTLREAGADIRSIRRPERPPLRIRGQHLDPGALSMNPGVSSQFVSALMLASPLWKRGLKLTFEGGQPVSLPYLEMTRRVMESFGCEVEMAAEEISVAPAKCTAPEVYEIPTDWSAASYFYELALLLPGREIPLLQLTPPEKSLQGDSACAEIFHRLGVRTDWNSADGSATLSYHPESHSQKDYASEDFSREGQDRKDFSQEDYHPEGFSRKYKTEPYVLDLNGTPDLAPALAVGFCLAGVRFRFENVAHLRHKETDRMASLATELRKLGFALRTGEDSMEWTGQTCEGQENPVISTYSDHRMAMAFAPAAIRFPGLTIENPDVIGKSFPCYWEMLRGLGFSIEAKASPKTQLD